MNENLAATEIRPAADRTYPTSETIEAPELLKRGGHVGKIVIKPG
jgi:NADPH:quinone reductase-like Zn-dependent oxidoreductase